jgi:hypothetical protein
VGPVEITEGGTNRALSARSAVPESKLPCGAHILDDSSDLPMDRMARWLTSPGIRTANGFLAEHWRSVGSPCPVAL